jgi:hypothetical protein
VRKPKSLHLCLFLTFLIIFSSNIFAINLAQYRNKISKVKESTGYLLYPENYLSEAENAKNQTEIIKEIRATLAENEKIELGGSTFEVSHKWFFDKLTEFEKEAPRSDKRTDILNEVFARFSALETKLNELEEQETSARTKDEDKQKLDQILKRQEYQKPEEKKETWFQQTWREFWEWFKSLFPKNSPISLPEASPEGISTGSYGLQIVVYGLVIGLIGFFIYRFAPFFFKQIKNRERREKKTRVILGETIAAEETSHNIFSEAEKLALEGNLRGAIRKGYIALLCELSDRKIIGLARHKTNRDYLRDVKKRKEIYSEMNTLTGSFERNWYGVNSTDQDDWEEFKQTYQRTVSKT